ncbi:SDR family NAD(P)-dependent oxidoreductase [Pararhizobium sp. PWRC1-1]|uniref:SDR family NAD(P)-dependent oxidoreductase n=1 Tax=Pararhizobium sp. PWRC1-1 TaxID=2804566 RepID=UPI003CF0176A
MKHTVMGTALITGASTGIGAVYADRLSRRGYDLILVARNAANLETIAARVRTETGQKVEVRAADLTNSDDLASIERCIETDASITLLVNNAGIDLNGGLLDNKAAELKQLIDLNITAPTVLAAAAGRAFMDRKAGAIINIASVLAFAPEFLDGVYSGSKAYLLNLSLSMALKMTTGNVQIQVVLPGATRTEIWERSGKDVDAIVPEAVMDAGDLVDAALVGFDKREVVTIPPLADERLWLAYNEARLAMAPYLSKKDVAPRYQ